MTLAATSDWPPWPALPACSMPCQQGVQRGGQREHLWSDWSPPKLHPHVFWVGESDSGSISTRFGPTEQQEQAACGAVVGPWKGVHISVWGKYWTPVTH